METKDALLHAINEEYVEAVEVLAAFNMIMRRLLIVYFQCIGIIMRRC